MKLATGNAETPPIYQAARYAPGHIVIALVLIFVVVGCSAPMPIRGRKGIFDVHLHAMPPEVYSIAAQFDFGAYRKTAGRNVRDADAFLQQTLAFMDESGVTQGLVSGDNELVLDWAAKHPERFLPSFSPDLTLKDHGAAVAKFREEVAAGKWRAIGELLLPYAGMALDDPRLFPYYAACEEAGIPAFFHTGLNGPVPRSWGFPAFRVELGDPLHLQTVVDRFPGLNVVIMHMGWPFFDHALYMLYTYPNVYMDVAVTNWILGEGVFRRMLQETVETVGSDRVLFGSDQMAWPQMIPVAIRSIESADFLSPADKRNILCANAHRLMGLETPGSC